MNQQIPKIDFVKKIREIKKKKFVPTLRIDNTGIGFTLETMLGIRENNYTKGDFIDTGIYNGILFELKSQRYQKHDPRTKKTKKNSHLITLVTQAPHWGLTNSELLKKYGYQDEKNRNRKNLYATISANKFIKSKYKSLTKMKIRREKDRLHLTVDNKKVAYVDLNRIFGKLKNLLVVRADSQYKKCSCKNSKLHDKGYHEYFYFNTPCIFTGFRKRKFYQSIDNGEVKYDLRMHKPMNKLTGNENYDTNHDHGTGFRVKFENISKFYDNVKTI